MFGTMSVKVTPVQVAQLVVKTSLSVRTVEKYFAGGRLSASSRVALERACKALKIPAYDAAEGPALKADRRGSRQVG